MTGSANARPLIDCELGRTHPAVSRTRHRNGRTRHGPAGVRHDRPESSSTKYPPQHAHTDW